MTEFYKFDHKDKMTFLIAASLHDIGKLAISNKLLDKNGKLTYKEMEIMKSHVYYTRKALSRIVGFEEITNWASNHHEKLNGKGYPLGLNADQLTLESRVLAIADIFEALTASDRPYKEPKTLSQSIKILSFMVKDQHLDADLCKLFLSSGLYKKYAQEFLLPQQIDEVDIEQYLK